MGEPAKKLKDENAFEPSNGAKPIELQYFYSRQNYGATPNNLLVSAKHATNGSSFDDGNGVSGICEAITLYPSGFVVATIRGLGGNMQEVVITGGGNGKVAR
jgi:hypothetical protein